MKSFVFLRNSSLILMMSLAVLACGGQKPSQTQPQTQPASFSPDALTGRWDFVEGKVCERGEFTPITAAELTSTGEQQLLNIEFKPNQVILNAHLEYQPWHAPTHNPIPLSVRWDKNRIFLTTDEGEISFTASIVDSKLTLEVLGEDGTVVFFIYKRHVPAERSQVQSHARGGEEERVSRPGFRGRMMDLEEVHSAEF